MSPDWTRMHWEPANPPVASIPLQPDDPALLHPNLEHLGPIQVTDYNWRCTACGQIQRIGNAGIMIVDGSNLGDEWGASIERQRSHAWNGSFSLWCIPCCQSLLPQNRNTIKTYWRRILRWFRP